MGIPGFLSWLIGKYPKIIEDKSSSDRRNEVQSNRSGVQFHNLYLDMNQIVHTCAKTEKEQAPKKTDDEIIQLIFDYIDRIFSIIRPCQLLYMAMDGVTPRARMTHQRSQRFRESINISNEVKDKLLTDDQRQTASVENFDKCKIKPGTEFMSTLSDRLRHYIYYCMNKKRAWQSIEVKLSDSNVPGEGEHKIMDFIRRQSAQSDHSSKTRHVVYSSDSDLILLGLATHERHFTIIYERCGICRKPGHDAKECIYKIEEERDQLNKISLTTSNNIGTIFISLRLSKLRKYLREELKIKHNRGIDDWIFLCLLLGNDFLPILPSIDRPEDSMDSLLSTYKGFVTVSNEHLTNNGVVNLGSVEMFLKSFGKEESEIFRNQHRREKEQDECSLDLNDTIRLWETGWHERYYTNKFHISQDNLKKFCTEVAQHYTRGLCWILQYYYQGVPSWDWYYPYHYAPFPSDFSNLENVSVNFNKNTQPFSPLEQMIATFPPQNAIYLPIEWQKLMLDKESSIIDFYPTKFYIDLNGKREKRQGVALLPFVDEERLRRALEPVYSTLTLEEEKRNRRDYDCLFIHSTNSYYKQFRKLYSNSRNEITQNNPLPIQIGLSHGMTGEIWPVDKEKFKHIGEEIIAPTSGFENVSNNQVISVKYRNPQFPDGYIFKTKTVR